jgi:hypothetical protein
MATMTKRPSHHLLPMPSVIFKSRANLHTRSNLHDIDEDAPDEVLTALPAPPTIDDKPKRASLWRRFVNRIKSLGKGKETEVIIGEPTGFRHVATVSGDESEWEDEEE